MPRPPKVLAVLGHEEQPNGLVDKLEACGTRVQTAEDCLAAMALVRSEAVDLAVVVDRPGDFNLAETARVLKSLHTDVYLPVIGVVESGLPPDRRRTVLEGGVDDVVPTTVDEETLGYRVHAAMRLKAAHRQLQQVRNELEKTVAREADLLKQLRQDNRTLKVRSITDGLTALYNYRYLMEWLKTEFKISQRYGHNLSMVIVDLDHFKSVNDQHGHPFGDYVLKEVAVILKQCARESDLVARYAGDEFALICPRTGHKEVRALASRILSTCRKHRFAGQDGRVPINLSLGTATYPQDPEIVSPELLVFLADQALYYSKRQGRASATAWHEIDAQARMTIRRNLRGPGNPLLANDPRSRLELAAAVRLAGARENGTARQTPQETSP